MHNNIISITVHQTVVYINKLKAQKIKKKLIALYKRTRLRQYLTNLKGIMLKSCSDISNHYTSQ